MVEASKTCYYELLEVDPTATTNEIMEVSGLLITHLTAAGILKSRLQVAGNPRGIPVPL
jgi:hypothetical protein